MNYSVALDRSNQVSKARLIKHYVAVVEVDRLPAPFNVVQWITCAPILLVDLCFSTMLYKDAKHFFGRFVFWAILGPIAVAAGWLLWVASVLKAATVVWRASSHNTRGAKIGKVIFALLCCTVGAPVWLCVLWIKGGLAGMRSVIKTLRLRVWGLCYPGRERVETAHKLRTIIFSHHPSDSTQNAPEDAREDAVTAMLKEADRGQ